MRARDFTPRYFLLALPSLIVLLLNACQGQTPRLTDATRTLQAERSIQQATQMALTLEATFQAQDVARQATAQAIEALFATARGWEATFYDTFETPQPGWPTGEDTDPLASINWQMDQGVFRWEAQSNDSFVWWAIPDMEPLADFYLSVQAQQVEGPPTGEFGLVFRWTEDSDYYLYELNGQGDYAFFSYIGDEWEALRPWTPEANIAPGGPNQLGLLAEGPVIYLLVNGIHIDTISDDRLLAGSAGLLIGLSEAGERGVWQFDEFEMRASLDQPALGTPEAVSFQSGP